MDRDEDLELGADRQEVLNALLKRLEVGVEHEALELKEHGEVELEDRAHLRTVGVASARAGSVRARFVSEGRVSEGRGTDCRT